MCRNCTQNITSFHHLKLDANKRKLSRSRDDLDTLDMTDKLCLHSHNQASRGADKATRTLLGHRCGALRNVQMRAADPAEAEIVQIY